MTLSLTNNKGYIFIVRRFGKQSKLILSRSDSITNLKLNLRYMAYVAQMLTQKPIYKPSSIFCFKPILLSAHKLILLIYGDNIYVLSSLLESCMLGLILVMINLVRNLNLQLSISPTAIAKGVAGDRGGGASVGEGGAARRAVAAGRGHRGAG